MEQMMDVL